MSLVSKETKVICSSELTNCTAYKSNDMYFEIVFGLFFILFILGVGAFLTKKVFK